MLIYIVHILVAEYGLITCTTVTNFSLAQVLQGLNFFERIALKRRDQSFCCVLCFLLFSLTNVSFLVSTDTHGAAIKLDILVLVKELNIQTKKQLFWRSEAMFLIFSILAFSSIILFVLENSQVLNSSV